MGCGSDDAALRISRATANRRVHLTDPLHSRGPLCDILPPVALEGPVSSLGGAAVLRGLSSQLVRHGPCLQPFLLPLVRGFGRFEYSLFKVKISLKISRHRKQLLLAKSPLSILSRSESLAVPKWQARLLLDGGRPSVLAPRGLRPVAWALQKGMASPHSPKTSPGSHFPSHQPGTLAAVLSGG